MRKAILAALIATACGGRPDTYDAPIANVQAIGLDTQVALVDDGAHRVVLLTPLAEQDLARASLPVGKGVIRAEASADGKRLFVLSTGDVVRKKDQNEKPSLTVIENGGERTFTLESPHSGFSIDPEGRYVALFAAPGGTQTTFVENPNEIVVVDLDPSVSADQAVTPRTIRSFGARPQRVSFTPTLGLPGGQRRLLVIETDQDISMLDLDHLKDKPQRPEITVRLTSGATAEVNRPGGVVFDDGDPAANDDSRIGVRIEGGSNVFLIQLVAQSPDAKAQDPTQVPNDFTPIVNLTDVGGAPGDIVFVHTDVGLRLAALVPSTKTAVLVDPATSITQNVDLPDAFQKISLITNVVSSASGTDTALLYGSGSAGVAFWSLGKAEGQPYRSVEVVALGTPIVSVEDVPPPRPQLKVLDSSGADAFYVLDLTTRTASPLTTLATATLHVARDGQRVWAFQRSQTNLSVVSLQDLHPIPLPLDRPIDSVWDLARADGGRSLVAIDARGAVGATVLDALAPDTTQSKSFYGFLLEDL
ncbi:MAG TPA: hypothetical protein VIF62_39600 [Labilithrix sp.]